MRNRLWKQSVLLFPTPGLSLLVLKKKKKEILPKVALPPLLEVMVNESNYENDCIPPQKLICFIFPSGISIYPSTKMFGEALTVNEIKSIQGILDPR